MGNLLDTLENIKGLWTMAKYGLGRISSTFIPYGHQVCKNNDSDGITELRARHHMYHKVEREEHAIDDDHSLKTKK